MIKITRILGTAAALLLVACQSVQTTQPGAVGVSRKQSMSSMVSEADIEKTAAQQYQAELAKARRLLQGE